MIKSKAKKIIAKPAKRKLTLKQKKFTAEVIKTGNATQAAIKAGYSKKTASEMGYENLNKPHIKEIIQSAAAKLGIDAEYVLGNFKEIAEHNKKKIFITRNESTHEEMIDSAAVIKSTELLGKHLSLFAEKLEIKAEIKTEIKDEDLTQLARELAFMFQKANQ